MDKPKNKFLSVVYQLYSVAENGEKHLEEQTSDLRPFEFITGFGISLDRFEEEVSGLEKGEHFDFTLKPEEAFGDYVPEGKHKLDRSVFMINGHFDHEHIYIDAVVPLQNEDGNRFYGRIVEIGEEKVKVDLNHPLAGESLHFEGKVLENREATNEEIQGMINRMSGGCGCGCHDCEGDCDGHHHDGCDCGHCH